MIPDTFIRESRLRALHALPWPIPATVVIEMTDEDLDVLAAAGDRDVYWSRLNQIVARITADNLPPALPAPSEEL